MNILGVDLDAISEAVGAIREAGSTLKDGISIAKKVRDQLRGAPDAAKQEEILGHLGSLSEKLADVQLAHLELVDRLHQAETALRATQANYDEAQRYQLTSLAMGGFVLALKKDDAKGEPFHYLCQPCYDDGKKRILQPFGRSESLLECPGCKQTFRLRDTGSDVRISRGGGGSAWSE